jgi:hypothetical protein
MGPRATAGQRHRLRQPDHHRAPAPDLGEQIFERARYDVGRETARPREITQRPGADVASGELRVAHHRGRHVKMREHHRQRGRPAVARRPLRDERNVAYQLPLRIARAGRQILRRHRVRGAGVTGRRRERERQANTGARARRHD